MKQTLTIAWRAFVVASALAVSVVIEASAQSTTVSSGPRLDQDHARLAGLSGTWDVELIFRFQPGRAPVGSKGISTIRPLFDGLFIEEKIEGSMNNVPFTTLAWTGFNTSTHQYEATRISSTNPGRIAEAGAWDEQTHSFELKASYVMAGDTWTQRTVIQPISATSMVATSYLSFGKVPEWKAVEIKYTRSAK